MDIREILEAVDLAMTKVKTIADLPGVNMLPYVSTLSGVIGATHAAYVAGKSIEPYVTAITDTFGKDGVPTESDMAALDAKIAELEAKVQAPLPPKEEGEPD